MVTRLQMLKASSSGAKRKTSWLLETNKMGFARSSCRFDNQIFSSPFLGSKMILGDDWFLDRFFWPLVCQMKGKKMFLRSQ